MEYVFLFFRFRCQNMVFGVIATKTLRCLSLIFCGWNFLTDIVRDPSEYWHSYSVRTSGRQQLLLTLVEMASTVADDENNSTAISTFA